MAELDIWLERISKEGEIAWGAFYKKMLRHAISNVPRFGQAVENYGLLCVFSAIIASSEKKFSFSDDPLNYVLAVARIKWEEQQREKRENAAYTKMLKESRERSLAQGLELEEKIQKARENVRATR
jgi:hypothetical protein